ncbi:TapB family protein [Aquimarina litoralis]|uniref:TapB family protein n=1 Tax=Aquimarina litoralis TaxID=584605 RepID=UPI001C583C11|nr:hypothetical protein [Aquimarina litoralis]MBW1294016.1 hypothetical protein [Aquimarina litoralis]
MKTQFLIFTFFCISISYAQSNCSPYYPSKIGTKIKMHHFNNKNKLVSETNYKVVDVNSSEKESKIVIAMEVEDAKKKKNITQSKFTIICKEGITFIDPETIISPQLYKQYQNMDYSIKGEGIDIPNSLVVGQQLKDGQVSMSIDAGVMSIEMTVDLKNREVQSRETITTSAGSFDCFLITYTNETTMSMGMKQTFLVKQWISKNVGLVQQETTKPNGKLLSKSILATFQ